MSGEHDGEGDPRYTAVYGGVVVRRDDPLKIGRVKVRVPGLIEPESGWALPGTIGGGSPGRGIYFVPEVGSEVDVWFTQGDPDHPRYICGNWTARGGVSSVNARVVGKSAEEAPKVKVIETERWLIVLDDSDLTPALLLQDKQGLGDKIEFDGLTRQITLIATTGITIQSLGAIDIKGLAVTLNGRPVLPSSEPI